MNKLEALKMFNIVFMIGSILFAVGGGIWSYGIVLALYLGIQQWIIFIKRESKNYRENQIRKRLRALGDLKNEI